MPRRGACPSAAASCASFAAASTEGSSFLPLTSFSKRGMARSRVSRSARISSVLMVSMSDFGSTVPSTCTTSESVEAAHDLRDRVGLADVREELVAEPLALGGAAHDAGDVDERHGGGQDALGAEDAGERLEPRVGQVHHADVRFDRREGVVRREHLVLGERVEQGGLADVGQADDADSESHGGLSYRQAVRGIRRSGLRPPLVQRQVDARDHEGAADHGGQLEGGAERERDQRR